MTSTPNQSGETEAIAGPRIGELFAGYGGLGMGVQAVLGGEVAWYSDVCRFEKDGTVGHHDPHRGACAILAHRFPGVPNLGDVTKINWSTVEPVDILTGGSPCQDLSAAGKRAGMTDGTRSNLWVAMREAIAQLRPSLVVWENVRGAYSAEADSAVEPCPGCVGDGSGVSLRALGRVLGDLSDLGYDTRWHGLPASDIGAPHGRFRVFVAAADAQSNTGRFGDRDRGALAVTAGFGRHEGRPEPEGLVRRPDAAVGGLLPTPTARDSKGHNQRRDTTCLTGALLPTPSARLGDGTSRGASHPDRRKELSAKRGGELDEVAVHYSPDPTRWGNYASAIARWEDELQRAAPSPTQLSTKGTVQLAQTFVEWMMGIPDGWVTAVPGIARNEALKALGNGVVPQQAETALREMFAWEVAA